MTEAADRLDGDDRHECPRDGCDFRRYSLLAIEFHLMDEHPDDEGDRRVTR